MKTLNSVAIAFVLVYLLPGFAMAAPANALCGLVDGNMLSSLQLTGAAVSVPAPATPPSGVAPTDVTSCMWSKKGGAALTLSSSPFKGALPTSCNVQQIAGGASMTMCMASGGGGMLSVVLVQPAGKIDQDAADRLRRHTDALAAKLSKATKPS